MSPSSSANWLFAQTPQPSPPPTSTISPEGQEILKRLDGLQKEAVQLKQENKQLTESQVQLFQTTTAQMTASYDYFVNMINTQFTIVTVLTAIIALVAGGTLWEIRKKIKDLVEQQVAKSIAEQINKSRQIVERSLEREEVIDRTIVDYILPTDAPVTEATKECQILRKRGFQEVRFCSRLQELAPQTHKIVILDFVNENFQNEDIIRIVEEVSNILSNKSVLVIYINRRVDGLDNFFTDKQIYYTPANNAITLIGRVVDAAQTAYALQQEN